MPDIDYNQLYNDPTFQAFTPHDKRVALATVIQGDPKFQAIPSEQQDHYRNLALGQFPDDSGPDALKLEPPQLHQLLGTKYKFGGESCNGIDCSSLTQKVYGANGVDGMPRTADAQLNWQHGQRIDNIQDIQPGDHLFFQGSRLGPGKASHTGYFAGWDDTPQGRRPMMYAASSTAGAVVKQPLDSFLAHSGQQFLAAKRYSEFQRGAPPQPAASPASAPTAPQGTDPLQAITGAARNAVDASFAPDNTAPNLTPQQQMDAQDTQKSQDYKAQIFAPDKKMDPLVTKYADDWKLTDPENKDTPAVLTRHLARLPLDQRDAALPQGLSPVGRTAILRAAYQMDPRLPQQATIGPNTTTQNIAEAKAGLGIADRSNELLRQGGINSNVINAQQDVAQRQYQQMIQEPGAVMALPNKAVGSLISGQPIESAPTTFGAIVNRIHGPGTYEAAKEMPGFLNMIQVGLPDAIVDPTNLLLGGGVELVGKAAAEQAVKAAAKEGADAAGQAAIRMQVMHSVHSAAGTVFGAQAGMGAAQEAAQGHWDRAAADLAVFGLLAAGPHLMGKLAEKIAAKTPTAPEGDTSVQPIRSDVQPITDAAGDTGVPTGTIPGAAAPDVQRGVPETIPEARPAKGQKPGASPQEATAAPIESVSDVSPAKPGTSSPAAGEAVTPAPKEPWQMTSDEFERASQGATYGDWYTTPDGKFVQMRGSGGMGSERVRGLDVHGKDAGYYNRSELKLVSKTARVSSSTEAADKWLEEVSVRVKELKSINETLLSDAALYDRFAQGVRQGQITPEQFKAFQDKGTISSDIEYARAQSVRQQIEDARNTALEVPENKQHKAIVERALAEGKPVPPEVLADYPDLAAKASPEPAGPSSTAAETDYTPEQVKVVESLAEGKTKALNLTPEKAADHTADIVEHLVEHHGTKAEEVVDSIPETPNEQQGPKPTRKQAAGRRPASTEATAVEPGAVPGLAERNSRGDDVSGGKAEPPTVSRRVPAGRETSGKGGVPEEVRPEETTGIAQRVHDRRAAEGRTAPIEPGKGAGAETMVKRGRADLLKRNPEARLAQVEKDPNKAFSADDIALWRAKHEDLGKATDRAYDKVEANPADKSVRATYEAAKAAEDTWAKRIKPYQTEWSKMGHAQQGETGLDTGSFTSLRREFVDRTGRDMNAKEEKVATAHADKVTELQSKVDDLQTKLDAALKEGIPQRVPRAGKTGKVKELPADPELLRQHFADRVANGSLFRDRSMANKERGAVNTSTKPVFTQSEIKAIWDHARTNYIDKGVGYHDMVNSVATDLGLKPEWVQHALAQNKTVRNLSNEMYRAQYERRKAVNAAKRWVEGANTPQYVKIYQKITNFPRSLAVLGHANPMVTHAGANIFRPSAWAVWGRNFVGQFRNFGSKAVHEAAMQTIERDDLYPLALRSGLKVDPGIQEDYSQYGRLLGVVGEAGNRGMDALKTFRMEYWKQELAKFPEDIREDVAPLLAQWVNHVSGYGNIGHGTHATVIREAMFAPGLEASRWARIVGDPIQTAKTFANWKNAPAAEQAMAKFRVNRAAQLASVYMGALVANTGLQMATRQEDKTNFTDPTKSDFLRFKWNGHTLDPTGNMMGPFRYLANVLHALYEGTPKSGYNTGKTSLQVIGGDTMFYMRGKLAPQYGIAADVADRKDAIGKPLPFEPQRVGKSGQKLGKEPYSWTEYALQHGPIPASGAAREAYDTMRESGMEDKTAHAVVNALMTFGVEALGVKIGKTPSAGKGPVRKVTVSPGR